MKESTAPDPVLRALDNVMGELQVLRDSYEQQSSADQFGWLLAVRAMEDKVMARMEPELARVDRAQREVS